MSPIPFVMTKDEFLTTFKSPMKDVTYSVTDVIDIWPYVDSISCDDLKGHVIDDGLVEYVYRSSDEAYEHVLVMTKTRNVYLVIVIDLSLNRIYGHHLLDLNEEYGLILSSSGPPETEL